MLYKTGLTLIIIILTTSSILQNNSLIIASFKYKVSYVKEGIKIIDDVCQLDVSKNQSYFYSVGKQQQIESIGLKLARARSTGQELNFESDEIKTNLYQFNTIKEYGKKLAIVTERIGGQNLGYVKDSLNNNDWTIHNDKIKIGNLVCQKATKIKNKITVTAWFCKDIPLKEGPFFYYGLPGLIVKANSSLGWQANLISMNNIKNSKAEIEIEPYKLVSETSISKARANNQAKSNNNVIVMPNGTKLNRMNN